MTMSVYGERTKLSKQTYLILYTLIDLGCPPSTFLRDVLPVCQTAAQQSKH